MPGDDLEPRTYRHSQYHAPKSKEEATGEHQEDYEQRVQTGSISDHLGGDNTALKLLNGDYQ